MSFAARRPWPRGRHARSTMTSPAVRA